MTRTLLLTLFLTFSISAKTLDNKVFCELMEKGKEAEDLQLRGQAIKGKRLKAEVEKELKSMIAVGLKIIPDDKLRIYNNYSINCQYGDNKNYYQHVGYFSICYDSKLQRCPNSHLTESTLIERIQEETVGVGTFMISGIFQIPKIKYDLFTYDTEFNASAIIMNIESISKIKEE